MKPSIRRELVSLLTWLLFMFAFGTMFGEMLLFLFIGLLAYVLWCLYNLRQLAQWLSSPSKKTPESMGLWDEIYYQLYQLYKRQRKARRRLTSILNRFQKSTQALPYATVVLNQVNEIEWFNPAASQLFGLRSGYDIGQRIDNLIRQPEFVAYIVKKEYKKPLEFKLDSQNVLLNITPYGAGQFLLSAEDITQQSIVNEMRRDFISNASHELRTPITVMSGYLEMLTDNADENMRMPLEKIQQQTERMKKIITELLELAKLESSEAVDKTDEVNTQALFDEIFNEALALDQSKHQLESEAKPVALCGSYAELRMAFSNLLTNAIRYTPEGGHIQLYTEINDSVVAVGVRDSGIGIGYEHLSRLTERFYRVDEGRSREKGGTGLGLAIVKQVLDRHGGSLHVSSEPGKGSEFVCQFPRLH